MSPGRLLCEVFLRVGVDVWGGICPFFVFAFLRFRSAPSGGMDW